MAEYDKDTAPNVRPSRVGMRTIITYVTPEMSAQLRHLAIDLDTSVQALATDAFQMLLDQHSDKVRDTKPPAVGAAATRGKAKTVRSA